MSLSARLKSFSQSASIVLALRIFGLLFTLASVPILARELGPEGRGQSAAAIAIIVLLPVVISFGTSLLIRKTAARELHSAEAMVRSLRRYALIAGFLTAGLTLFLRPILLPGLPDAASTAFCFSTPIAVFTGILWISDCGIMIGKQQTLKYSIITTLPSITMASSVVVLWLTDHLTVATAIWAQAASYIVTFAFSTVFTRVSLRGAHTPMNLLLQRSSRFAGSQVAEAASFRLDQAIILPLIGAHQAGLYSVAATITLLPFAFGEAIAAATFRQASDESQMEDRGLKASLLLRLTLIAGIGISTGIGAVTPWAIQIAFGTEYEDAILPTLIGLVGAVGIVVAQSAGTLHVTRNQGWRMTFAQVIGLCAGLVLLMALSFPFGIIGASIASALGYLITAMILVKGLSLKLSSLIFKPSDWKSIASLFLRGRY